MCILSFALVLIPLAVQGGPILCPKNTRYVVVPGAAEGEVRGRCEECPTCDGGGFVLNRTLALEYDKRYGYLSCWPCDPCPPRYFREAHSPPVCNRCSKNCSSVNRYESQPCGGSSPGHCGECLPGFKAISSSAEGMCVARPEPEIPEIKSIAPANLPEYSTFSGQMRINVNAHASVQVGSIQLIVGVSVAMVVAVGVIVYFKCRHHATRCKRSHAETEAGESTVKLIHSDETLDGGVDIDGKRDEKVRGEIIEVMAIGADKGTEPMAGESAVKLVPSQTLDGSVEIDGERDDKVRGEIIEVIAIGADEGFNPYQLTPAIHIPTRKFDINNQFTTDCFMCLSRRIPPYNRNILFHNLGLSECDYLPEEELWRRNSAERQHADFVYNVLKIWLQRHYDNADLLTLCESLNKVGCGDIVHELVIVAAQHGHQTEPKQVS